jgi:hypothetical protein
MREATMDPLDQPCPTCHAHRGERCAGGLGLHPARRALTNQRETRYYDLDPTQLPAGHDNAPPPTLEEIHRISDDNRHRGMRAIDNLHRAHPRLWLGKPPPPPRALGGQLSLPAGDPE